MIPRDFLDDLISRTDIVTVIGSHLELKKKGSNFSALCPFHSEKTPSFTVNAHKQFYHCFGCGASGDAVKFLMDYCGLSFTQVLSDLAKQHGMTVPNESQIQSTDFKEKNLVRSKLKQILITAARFYQKNLKENQKAVAYLKSRGISGKTALRFHLGVSLRGWSELRSVFHDDYDFKSLIDSGLVIQSESKSSVKYDRFRNRLMFPIFNISGEVIGFGARSFGDEQPKYLNSPETEIFSKGKELYGIFEAKGYINKAKEVIVVEGYMDVIGLYENGVKNTVATLGTSFTKVQFSTLSRIAETIVFMFDGDAAGKKAARRALNVILPELKSLIKVDFVFLPTGNDPDNYIRSQGLDAMNLLLKQAMPLSEFLFDLASKQLNQNIVEGRTKIVSNLQEFLKVMHEGILKNQIILEAVKRFDFSAEVLNNDYTKFNYSHQKKLPSESKKLFSRKLIPLNVRIFKIFIRFPVLLREIDDLLSEIEASKYPIFSDIQKNAIIVLLNNSDFSKNSKHNLAKIKEAIKKTDYIDDDAIHLLKKGCDDDSTIDDMPDYGYNSAKEDVKYILKRLLINCLESQASQIIKNGESFDKLSEVRNKISNLTGNKL